MLNTKANTSDVKSVKPVRSKREPVWSASVGLRLARRAGHETLYLRRCKRNESEVSGAIYDCTGGIIPNLFRNPLQGRLFTIFDLTGGIIPNLFRNPLQGRLFTIFDCTGGIIPNLFQNLLPRRLFIIFDYTGGKGNKCLVL